MQRHTNTVFLHSCVYSVLYTAAHKYIVLEYTHTYILRSTEVDTYRYIRLSNEDLGSEAKQVWE